MAERSQHLNWTQSPHDQRGWGEDVRGDSAQRRETSRRRMDQLSLDRPAPNESIVERLLRVVRDRLGKRVERGGTERADSGRNEAFARVARFALGVGLAVAGAAIGVVVGTRFAASPEANSATRRPPGSADTPGSSVRTSSETALATLPLIVDPAAKIADPSADPAQAGAGFLASTTSVAMVSPSTDALGRSSPGIPVPTIAVHAAGAVNHPAVYNLPIGARVDDVVGAAGGLAPGADSDGVNLAARLADGERIYVPFKGRPVPAVQVGTAPTPPPAGDGSASPVSGPVSTTSPIDLNTATAEQLDSLPGVGPATADKIIEHRTRIGRFRKVTQLLEVPGIGDAKFAALKSRVRV